MKVEIILFIKTIKAMRKILIIAPYGNEELDTLCRNNGKKTLVYLRTKKTNGVLRTLKHEIIFCEKDECKIGREVMFCEHLVSQAVECFEKKNIYVVFVVLPYELVEKLLEQARMEANEGKSGIYNGKFEIVMEDITDFKELNQEKVFEVKYHEHAGYRTYHFDFYFGPFHLQQIEPEQKKSEIVLPQKPEDECEEVSEDDFNEAALSRNYEKFTLPELNWILREFLVHESFEWVPGVQEAINKKKNK